MKVAGSSLICFHYSQMAQKRNEQKGTQKKKCSKKSWRMTSSKIMSPWTAMARQKEGRKATTTTVRRGSRCRNYSATTVPFSDHLITAAVVDSISVAHGLVSPENSSRLIYRTVHCGLSLLVQLFLPLPDLTTASCENATGAFAVLCTTVE
jgi:hypothetical protein